MDTTECRKGRRSGARDTRGPRRTSIALALALACLTSAACASALAGMQSELDIPEYRDVAMAERRRPESIVMVDTAAEGEPRVRIAVELRGRGDADHVVVAVHGLLSDRLTWRYIASCLEKDHDLMLVDLPGCGRSDKPDPDDLGPHAYTTTSMARRVLIALRHCLNARDNDAPVTVMAHSLGSAVTLRMLGDPGLRSDFADVLDRVESVVLLSPLDVRVEQQYAKFRRIAEISGLEIALGELSAVLPAQIVAETIRGVVDPARAIREEAERTIAFLTDRNCRRAAQAMIQRAVPFHANGESDWEAINRLELDYENVDVPCLIICGGRDETLPCSMAFKMQAQLPEACLRILPRAKHSLPTERPWTCALLVRTFIESRGKGWQAILEIDDDRHGRRLKSRVRDLTADLRLASGRW